MAVPVWATNQILLASDVNNWFVPIAAYKTSATSRTQGTTSLTADPDLSVTVAASSIYEVRASINYQQTAGNTSLEWNFTIPSGASGGYSAGYIQPGPTVGFWGNTWGSTVQAAASDGLSHGIVIEGLLVVSSTGGSFTLVWGLNPTGTSTLQLTTSKLVLTRVG